MVVRQSGAVALQSCEFSLLLRHDALHAVHTQLQPFLSQTPCTVAQLRAVARQLGEDDSIEVYFDPVEDRIILN